MTLLLFDLPEVLQHQLLNFRRCDTLEGCKRFFTFENRLAELDSIDLIYRIAEFRPHYRLRSKDFLNISQSKRVSLVDLGSEEIEIHCVDARLFDSRQVIEAMRFA